MSAPAGGGAPASGMVAEFVRLITVLIGVHACMSMSRMAAALWMLENGHGKSLVGVLLSVYSIGALVCALWAGSLTQRYGFHRPAAIATVATFIGVGAVALFQTLPAMLVVALLTGAATVIIEITVQRTGARVAQGSTDLKRVFSAIALATGLSSTLSPMIMGLLVDGFGFRIAFGLLVLLPVIVALVAMRVVRIAPGPVAAQATGTAWSLLKLPAVRRVLLVNLMLASSWDVHLFAVPVLGHERQMSASAIGLVLGCCSVGVFSVRVIITRWGEHFEEWQMLRAAMATAMVLLAVYAWLPGLPGMMLGSCLLGMCIGASQPNVLAALCKVTPEQQVGQALGLRIIATNGITAGMPLVYGAVATATTVAVPLGLIAAALAAVLMVVR